MESARAMHEVPPEKKPGGWKFRPGQSEFLTYLAKRIDEQNYFPGRYPTGYGKTEIIAASYAQMRERGIANRLLVIVPSETQEDQYAEEFQRKAKRMGISIRGVVSAARTERTLKYHRRNEAEVFIATIQRLEVATSGKGINWISELLETGAWTAAADEYHHYATHNLWGQSIRAIEGHGVKKWVALSATPNRKFGETIFGEPPPECVRTYDQALREEPPAVKAVSIKVREYGVTIEDINGMLLNCTSSDLIDETKDLGIDKWEARKQVRYLSKYSSPILFHAVQELDQLALTGPVNARPQLLVYAHSCLHAKSLVSIISGIAPGLSVDWAGTGPNGRDDSQAVIKRFMDEVDDAGRIVKHHELDALVQVNIASEGFDSKAVCVIVDLSLGGIGPQKLQQYGRGTRTYFDMPLTIYVPTDSEMAKFAPLMHGIFDIDIENATPPVKKEPGEDVGPFPPLPQIEVIDALLTGCYDYQPTRDEVVQVAPQIAQRKSEADGRPVYLDPEKNDQDYKLIEQALIAYRRRSESEKSEETSRTSWQQRVFKAVGQVARDYVIKTTTKGEKFEKSRLGDACKRLNSRWKFMNAGHDAMTGEEFKKKYQWLCGIQDNVRNGQVPPWLMA